MNGFKKTKINFYDDKNGEDNGNEIEMSNDDLLEMESPEVSEDDETDEDNSIREKMMEIFMAQENFGSDEDDLNE